jgi:enoyl-CoA hydratase/carnithine racemase
MPELDTEEILYEIDDYIAYITFNRPDSMNSMTFEMMEKGAEAIIDADDRDEVRAIIVTGAGDTAFSVGGDLEEMIPEAGDLMDEDLDHDQLNEDLMLKEDLVTTPMIAAVNGMCIGGGLEFLLATDIRVAEEHAQFSLQEAKWGVAPGGGSHVRLPRQIPYCKAMEILLTADLFSAEYAADAGLVNEVVPEGESLDRAEEIAHSIAENSPFAVKKIKEAAERGLNAHRDEAFEIETEVTNDVFLHPHAEEGPKAFQEDREPSFRP